MTSIDIFLYILILLSFFCLFRIIRGPSIADRMVAIDIFGILVVGICALMVVKTGRKFLIDIAITWVILSFIGTITLAKYLSRKKLNE
jgi:multicomponent Na+:H+ antiporter subunit F